MSLTQLEPRPGIIELAFGAPDGALLPTALIDRACRQALRRHARHMLDYGTNEGPAHLRGLLCDLIARREDRRPARDEILATGGNSHAFDLVLSRFLAPGDVVMVEEPTYSLGLRIIRDHAATVVPVQTDADGLLVDELRSRLAEVRRSGRRPRLLYTIPTYHNPTGSCLPPERRRRLIDTAVDEGLLIVEDDAYRELWYDRPPPPSLWAMAPPGVVVRLGSFSKTLSPGLRVGWLNATPEHVRHYAEAGVLESGGHVSTFSTFVVAELLADDHYDEHVAGLRRHYGRRRDALVEALRRELPDGCRLRVPGGGFFVRVELPAGLSATECLPVAERHGVSYQPGTASQVAGGDEALRLSFSYYPPDTLAEGAARLAAAVAECAAR